jgi:hypothetical protein
MLSVFDPQLRYADPDLTCQAHATPDMNLDPVIETNAHPVLDVM